MLSTPRAAVKRPGPKSPKGPKRCGPEVLPLGAGRDVVVAWTMRWDGYARKIALYYSRAWRVEYEDVLAETRKGFLIAGYRFDFTRRCRYQTIAVYWGRQAAQRYCERERGRGLTGCPPQGAAVASLDHSSPVTDYRAAERPTLLQIWCAPEYVQQRRALDWRSRIVLYLRTVACWTLEEIGATLGLTRERVRQIEEEAIRRLATYRAANARRHAHS